MGPAKSGERTAARLARRAPLAEGLPVSRIDTSTPVAAVAAVAGAVPATPTRDESLR